MQARCELEEAPQSSPFLCIKVLMILAERPEYSFDVLSIDIWGEFLVEPFHLLLTQLVKVISVLLSNMETVNH